MSSLVSSVANIDELRSIASSSRFNGMVVQTGGYFIAVDGGVGVYYFKAGDITPDNGGTVIQPYEGTGRWHLLSDTINIRQFGAQCLELQDEQKYPANLTAAQNSDRINAAIGLNTGAALGTTERNVFTNCTFESTASGGKALYLGRGTQLNGRLSLLNTFEQCVFISQQSDTSCPVVWEVAANTTDHNVFSDCDFIGCEATVSNPETYSIKLINSTANSLSTASGAIIRPKFNTSKLSSKLLSYITYTPLNMGWDAYAEVRTADATPTTLYRLTLLEGQVVTIGFTVLAADRSSSSNKHAAVVRQGTFYLDTNNQAAERVANLPLAPIVEHMQAGSTQKCEFGVSGQDVLINVTGLAGVEIHWAGQITLLRAA